MVRLEPLPSRLARPQTCVDVWLLDVREGLADEDCRGVVSPDEWARAQRFHFARDRALSLNARATLRLLLGRYLDLPPAELKFEYQSHGRPVLAPKPGMDPICFSVSHSVELVAIAVSHGDVGVDIEHAARPVDVLPLLPLLPEAEVAVISGLPIAEQSRAFLKCWTRKEARLKATGAGLAGSRLEDSGNWQFFDVLAGEYLGTVAVEMGCPDCRTRRLACQDGEIRYRSS